MTISRYSGENILMGPGNEVEKNLALKGDLKEDAVRGLLKQLSKMLKDHNVLAKVWPDVPGEHYDMFGYLNVEFDLHESKVTLETAAKSFSGGSIKKKEFSVKGELNIESKP